MEDIRQEQQRPSVLCQLFQTTSTKLNNNAALKDLFHCKEEQDTSHRLQSPSLELNSFSRQSHDFFVLRRDGPKQNLIKARLHDGIQDSTSALFVRGLCCWPGCEAPSEDFQSFLKHLYSEHSHGERSLAQWRVQQEMVQSMESQLILEKQKLLAMQLHLHLSEHKYTHLSIRKAASDWTYSLPLLLPQHQLADGSGDQQWGFKHVELVRNGYHAAGRTHLLPDLFTSIECYKYNNIRPPYTYAYLIRWAILESEDKQCTLNAIYNWFTTMFFYFRHNTATWKNAVRHNLSLHKYFVRVEGGKGAVWTVDETEYQRRKGQKFHRDCPVKWLTSNPNFCQEQS
ncbi:forkhead box protein P1-B-like isoform X2 [Genypterus blacodes]|uniref:forkhead box protein P1-B-like isoform X2 n=1 Tax=Genypterus blacodes TaxID=154954 RepID=UPI003F77770F